MKENYLEALKWYSKAADMGNAEAKYKMGKILWEEGKRYLQESCVQGNIAASEFIKENLKERSKVCKVHKEAKGYFQESREKGKIDASEFIKENLKEGNIDENESGYYIVFKSHKVFYLFADNRWDGIIEYSLDKINWHKWSGKGIKSDIIYMRGYGNTVITGGRKWHFQMNDRLVCRGNIETLLDYELCSRGEHPPMGKECYKSMFAGCTSLSEAPALPARELAEGCYWAMFKDCTSLKVAPALPARELALECYYAMFWGCTSLKEAPALPATELVYGCYRLMFEGCKSLEEAPALPATELADRCYESMFKDCKSLKVAPALPAKELIQGCYIAMFKGCTSLKEAPVLPATRLAIVCYLGMFSDCTSLKDKPNLPGFCF